MEYCAYIGQDRLYSDIMPISESGVFQIFSQLMWWEYEPNIVPRLVRDISFGVGTMSLQYLSNIERIFH